jgi:hypothetical protein
MQRHANHDAHRGAGERVSGAEGHLQGGHSGTVNDALRMLGVTGKQVTLRNPLRDALASARYHVLAATVLVRCMVRATMGSTIR